jgi:hypothetical protein
MAMPSITLLPRKVEADVGPVAGLALLSPFAFELASPLLASLLTACEVMEDAEHSAVVAATITISSMLCFSRV